MIMFLKILYWVRKNLLIILIVVFAFLLRFGGLTYVPPSLNWDEVSHGYNAYSILITGKDEWGMTFPTIFRAYGDYKLPVYIYTTAAVESLLGLNITAVRLPSVIAGTAIVLFTYLLVLRLTKKKYLSLLCAFLVAIEPWDLFVSRFASEANLSLALIVSGVYFLISGLEEKSKKILISGVLLGLSVWTYNSARIFVPLLLVGIGFIWKEDVLKLTKKRGLLVFSIIIFCLFFVPMFIQLVSPSGTARYGWVQILDSGSINKINEMRNTSILPGSLKRLLFNKVTYFLSVTWSNYFTHFSPSFLFLKGGSDYQFNVVDFGLLYLVNLPFFVLGLVLILKDFKKKKFNQLVAVWLILGPIASSLTREAPHVLRDIVSLPAPMILSGIGIFDFFSWMYKRFPKPSGKLVYGVILVVYIFVLGTSVENYAKKLVFDYRQNYSWSWQYGYKEVADYVGENYSKYGKIIITKKYGEPHEFLLFFLKWSPEKYRNDPNLIRFFQTNWYWVDRFDKFYFVNDWQIPHKGDTFVLESKKEDVKCLNTKCLLITGPDNHPKGWELLKTYDFLDGKRAFEIYAN